VLRIVQQPAHPPPILNWQSIPALLDFPAWQLRSGARRSKPKAARAPGLARPGQYQVRYEDFYRTSQPRWHGASGIVGNRSFNDAMRRRP
jgi:hypothetical protein